ncbi:hypothetical protein AVEN_244380-1 [Araneus ventricosus]|uniref:Uncharacterized protein n=1 Tax=Araneus ventricosus TaxID=182803 RepID=A0A4Y2JLE1_ARAVE|nr:hypothetical protein AVEN_244380-1 [Araneus ventricosus]
MDMGRCTVFQTERRPMPLFLMPLQQLCQLDGHGTVHCVLDRTPSHAPVPDAITATVPVGWTWDGALCSRQNAVPCSCS